MWWALLQPPSLALSVTQLSSLRHHARWSRHQYRLVWHWSSQSMVVAPSAFLEFCHGKSGSYLSIRELDKGLVGKKSGQTLETIANSLKHTLFLLQRLFQHFKLLFLVLDLRSAILYRISSVFLSCCILISLVNMSKQQWKWWSLTSAMVFLSFFILPLVCFLFSCKPISCLSNCAKSLTAVAAAAWTSCK